MHIFLDIKTSYTVGTVTRLGDFWKFLAINFLFKVAQTMVTVTFILTKNTLKYKLLWLHFWATLGKIGLLYNLTSGHTPRWSNFQKDVFLEPIHTKSWKEKRRFKIQFEKV